MAARFEPEPVLDSADLVQPALLSGPDFKVASKARLHGFMARFELTTPYGIQHPESIELLALREAELPAVATLEAASKTDAFAHALAERGRKIGRALWQVVSHPVDTLSGLPQGVARYFSRTLASWGRRAQALADRGNRQFEHDGDPYAAPDGPMTAGRTPLPGEDAQPGKGKAWYARAGREAAREVKRQLDFGRMRREMAKVLDIDPYTTNPLIVERLDALAWAAVAGNFSGGAALGLVGGVPAEIIGTGNRLNKLVWELDPEDLREANRKRLAAFCTDDFGIRHFLRRGGFTDSLRTTLTDDLKALAPTQGCDDLIELAVTSRSEIEARYLVNALRLLRQHAGRPGGRLVTVGAAVVWRMPDDRLVLPLPVDRLTWTADIDAFFALPALHATSRTVLIGGTLSARSRRRLEEMDWTLVEHAGFEGNPAYATPAPSR